MKSETLAGIMGVVLAFSGGPVSAVENSVLKEPAKPVDVYRAAPLKAATLKHDLAETKGFDWKNPDGALGRFTWFASAVKDQRVQGGEFAFTAAEPSVTLGWGNYRGRQPKADIVPLFDGANRIELKVKQSAATSSVWTLTLWGGGQGERMARYLPPNSASATVSGADRWQNLAFSVYFPGADGFALTIAGPASNQIAIKDIRVYRPETTGCFRRDFVIPQGATVWRAIGSFAQGTALYVNGAKIDIGWEEAQGNSRVDSADIAPYLRPGRNCLAMTGSFARASEVLFYFQGRVILTGGEVIELDSGPAWKFAPRPAEGWQQPDFDASAWTPPLDFERRKIGKREIIDPLYPGGFFAYSIWHSSFNPLIEYDGRIVYANPDAKRLWFRSEKPVVLEVRVPAGLAAAQPELDWLVRRVNGITEADVASGTATAGERRGDTLAFKLELGRLPQAVYTVATLLRAGGAELERRYREPFVVYGRTAQKEVAGVSYEEGLERELETEIDCTNPKDPHPWVDASADGEKLFDQPRIVTVGELTYREAQDDQARSFFAYKFQFKQPGSWYQFELEYPNDKPRGIGASITPSDRSAYSDAGPGVMTGMDVPVSGRMQALKWLHCADTGEQSLVIMSLERGRRAAARRIRLYRINGPLPALQAQTTGERFFGAQCERPIHIGLNFGLGFPSHLSSYFQDQGADVPGSYIYRLAWSFDVARRYTEYLRFSGQNFHATGCYQYNEDNNSYVPPNRVKNSSQVPCDIRDMLLKYFEANGIRAVSLIEYVTTRRLESHCAVTDAQVADGADTLMPMLRNGKQTGWLLNFMHPKVERAYLNIVRDLAFKFADSPAWMGVYLMPIPDPLGLGPCFCPPRNQPLDVGYEDTTIAEFEKATGVRVPGSGPGRFQARYDFLTSSNRVEQWIDWRCQRQRDIFVKTRDALREFRPDLVCLVNNYTQVSRFLPWVQSEKSYRDCNRLYGFDPEMYRKLDGVAFGRTMYTRAMPHHSPAVREHWLGPEVIQAYDGEQFRLVSAHTGWLELRINLPKKAGWPFTISAGRFLPQKDLDNRKECFTLAMVASDPNVVLFGFADVGQMVGQEQQTREIARALTSLPGVKLPWIAGSGLDSNLVIRGGAAGGKYYFYAANPGFWNVAGEIVLEGAPAIFDASSGERVTTATRDGRQVVPLQLGPFGVRTFYAENPAARAVGWQTAPAASQELGRLDALAQDYFSLLSDPKIVALMSADEIAKTASALAASRQLLSGGELVKSWRMLDDASLRLIAEKRPGFAKYAVRLRDPGAVAGPSGFPSLEAVKCSAPPRIDGDLNEPFWADVPYSTLKYMVDTQLMPLGPAITETRIRLAHDGQNLYVGVVCADREPDRAQAVAQNGPDLYLKHDDLVDLFVKPPGPSLEVFQFAVNPGGFQHAERKIGWGREHGPAIPSDQWRAASKRGTDRWTVECAIPLAIFDLGAEPLKGAEWRVNFRRRHREFLTVPEQIWSLVTGSYYHWQEYGKVSLQ